MADDAEERSCAAMQQLGELVGTALGLADGSIAKAAAIALSAAVTCARNSNIPKDMLIQMVHALYEGEKICIAIFPMGVTTSDNNKEVC